MPKKKPTATKKAVSKTKLSAKKGAVETTVAVRSKRATTEAASRKKSPRTVKRASPVPVVGETRSPEASTLEGGIFRTIGPHRPTRGTGAASAGQSGDVQGLSGKEDVDSESVEELLEEGQSHEAEVVSGVENALDPDQGEVRTRETPADDVPTEYIDED